MISEFTKLLDKVTQVTALVRSLREENAALRARVAALDEENAQLGGRMAEAHARVQALIASIPAEAADEEAA